MFVVKEGAARTDGLDWLLLTPKGDAAEASFRLRALGISPRPGWVKSAGGRCHWASAPKSAFSGLE
jgi:hypothetical protein